MMYFKMLIIIKGGILIQTVYVMIINSNVFNDLYTEIEFSQVFTVPYQLQ